MDFFKRMGRIARAELNSFTDRFREDDEGRGGDELRNAVDELDQEDAARKAKKKGFQGTSSGPSWPAEIRQAYAALELPLGSDRAEAKKAYRDMLKRYHPDKHHGNAERSKTATELTRRVREQYEVLDAFLEERGE